MVWYGDDNSGALVNDEDEIFGQRLTATGAETGDNDFRLSDMGPDGGTTFEAVYPKLAYNKEDGEYLIVWAGDDNTPPLVNNEREVFGQRFTPILLDLQLSQSVAPAGPVKPGQMITYTLSFRHTGAFSATGVVITDTLPSSLTQVSVISSGAAITTTGTTPAYIWQVQDLTPGQRGVITLSGRLSPTLSSGGRFTNTATIATNDGEDSLLNNVAEAGLELTIPQLKFANSAESAVETTGQKIITLTLSTPPLAPVSVAYATADGTAQAGSDYALTAGVLTFLTGTTVATFSVPLTDDLVDEASETLLLRLNQPQGARLTPPNPQVVLTLLDNETAGLLLPPALTITEGTSATYNVRLASQPTAPVTLTLNSDGQTDLSPLTLHFSGATWAISRTVTVTALADGLTEGTHSGTISHTLTSADPFYSGLGTRRFEVVLADETAGPASKVYLPALLKAK